MHICDTYSISTLDGECYIEKSIGVLKRERDNRSMHHFTLPLKFNTSLFLSILFFIAKNAPLLLSPPASFPPC